MEHNHNYEFSITILKKGSMNYAQQTFTCLKSTIEAIEKSVKCVQN